MLERLEQQRKLTLNQCKIMVAAVLGDMLDFFDYFLIGYVLAFIVHDWDLTYGQSAMILLAAGVGAVPGAFFWGWVADKIGRRKAFIGTALNFSLATGIMALTPDRDWVFLTVFRFFVGFGVSGLFAVDTTLVQEYVPASKRGWVGGLVTSCLPLGLTLGALLGRYLTPYIGWRGLFAVGLLPAALTLLIRAWVPESPRWLMRMGRFAEARQSLAWTLQVDPQEIELPTTAEPQSRKTHWREVFNYPRSLALSVLVNLSQTGGNGLLLWATTLFVLSRPDDLGQPVRLSRTASVLLLVGCDRPSPLRHDHRFLRCAVDGARRVSARRFHWRRVAILSSHRSAALLWRCQLRNHWTLFGGGVAGRSASKRHGSRLRDRQYRQGYRPSRTGSDRRYLQLCSPAGDARCHRPGPALPCLLVWTSGSRVLAARFRDPRPLDRRNRSIACCVCNVRGNRQPPIDLADLKRTKHGKAISSEKRQTMRRQWFRHGGGPIGMRLALRLERAAARMNPYLLAIVIGLAVLNVICFIGLRASPPKPVAVDTPTSVPMIR